MTAQLQGIDALRVLGQLRLILRSAENWWPTTENLVLRDGDMVRLARYLELAYVGELWKELDGVNDWPSLVSCDLATKKPWPPDLRRTLVRTLRRFMATVDMAAFFGVEPVIIERERELA